MRRPVSGKPVPLLLFRLRQEWTVPHRPVFCRNFRWKGYILSAMENVENVEKVEKMEKIKIEQHSFFGGMWCVAWLFTIGFLHLTFWKGVLAIVIWPYYLGAKLSVLLH
jgi:hypothetical protein